MRLLALDSNVGFGPAVNLVAARTSAPFVAPANADIQLRPGALRALFDAAGRHPRAGILAPRLELAVRRDPALGLCLSRRCRSRCAFNLGLANRFGDRLCLEGHWNAEGERDVDWALGAFLRRASRGLGRRRRVRRAAVDVRGGPRPGLARGAPGYSTRYVPSARVLHHASAATTQAWGDERTLRWLRSTYWWLLRRRGLSRTRATALINVLGAYARARDPYFRMWGGLHRRAGFAPRAELEVHR